MMTTMSNHHQLNKQIIEKNSINKHILVVLRIGHVNERREEENVEDDFVYRTHRC
jgi:hypothetical protein